MLLLVQRTLEVAVVVVVLVQMVLPQKLKQQVVAVLLFSVISQLMRPSKVFLLRLLVVVRLLRVIIRFGRLRLLAR
jgi:hypothetical protein